MQWILDSACDMTVGETDHQGYEPPAAKQDKSRSVHID